MWEVIFLRVYLAANILPNKNGLLLFTISDLSSHLKYNLSQLMGIHLATSFEAEKLNYNCNSQMSTRKNLVENI